jgi:hypothetical protein
LEEGTGIDKATDPVQVIHIGIRECVSNPLAIECTGLREELQAVRP